MSKEPVFFNSQGILITTEGPGKLHLFTYGPVANFPGVFGFVETTRNGVSNFIISHSYNYTKYAFYWVGKGAAEFRVGLQPERKPVGRNWNEASLAVWGNKEVLTVEVTPEDFQGAVHRDNMITCFLLPEDL